MQPQRNGDGRIAAEGGLLFHDLGGNPGRSRLPPPLEPPAGAPSRVRKFSEERRGERVRALSFARWGLLILGSSALLVLGASGTVLALRTWKVLGAPATAASSRTESSPILVAPLTSSPVAQPSSPASGPAAFPAPSRQQSVPPSPPPSAWSSGTEGLPSNRSEEPRSARSQPRSRDREALQRLWKFLSERTHMRSQDLTGRPTDEIPGSGDNTIDLSMEDVPEDPGPRLSVRGRAPAPAEWRPRR